MSKKRVGLALALMFVLGLVMTPVTTMAAVDFSKFADYNFSILWARTDRQVDDGAVARSYLWGPGPFTGAMQEDYAESPGGKRLVQYFDKSRMEITNPNGDKLSPYYVTNGLIAKELITGQMQLGDSKFQYRGSAEIGVAGDPDDTYGPTYKVLNNVLGSVPNSTGQAVNGVIDRSGNQRNGASEFGMYGVKNAYFVSETGHNIAKPFWDYLNQRGPIITSQGLYRTDQIFNPTFYATGFPITEAYWSKVKVAGQVKDVLVQAFERRVLTYTPSNPAGYTVEMGNVGQHYYKWRYSNTAPAQGCDTLPASKGGAYPFVKCGPAGMQIYVAMPDMFPGEPVLVTATRPDGSTTSTIEDAQDDGVVVVGFNTARTSQGQWSFKLEGGISGNEGETYLWLGAPVDKPTVIVYPNPGRLDQDITFVVVGFQPNEPVAVRIKGPADNAPIVGLDSKTTGAGAITAVLSTRNVYPAQFMQPGQWLMVVAARNDINRNASAVFTLTR